MIVRLNRGGAGATGGTGGEATAAGGTGGEGGVGGFASFRDGVGGDGGTVVRPWASMATVAMAVPAVMSVRPGLQVGAAPAGPLRKAPPAPREGTAKSYRFSDTDSRCVA